MGAKNIDQCVKSGLVFWAVDFRKLFHCFVKISVQLGSAGHSVAAGARQKNNEANPI